jgi:hypothetical protein
MEGYTVTEILISHNLRHAALPCITACGTACLSSADLRNGAVDEEANHPLQIAEEIGP